MRYGKNPIPSIKLLVRALGIVTSRKGRGRRKPSLAGSFMSPSNKSIPSMKNLFGKGKIPWANIALVSGVLLLVSGMASQQSIDNFFGGVWVVLGVLAYKSAKKRKLGLVKNSIVRQTLELAVFFILVGDIFLQGLVGGAERNIVDDPFNFLFIPAWVIIAYCLVALRKLNKAK